jgi:UDP-N-acetylmuramyl pentapeptide phosphotransferase/UDP-N-acetylglucosamine-1-phosphate transferase
MGAAAILAAAMLGVGAAAALGVLVLLRWLVARGVIDRPNARSSHTLATPRGGGLAVVAALAMGWSAALAAFGAFDLGALALLAGLALASVVGFADDVRGLDWKTKLAGQTAAVALGGFALAGHLAGAPTTLGVLACGAAFAFWLALVNFTNFMDGIDGLVGALSAVAGLVAAALLWTAGADRAWVWFAALYGAACVGFLTWNWPPARVFLGDAGSLPLGYVNGFLALLLAAHGQWAGALLLPGFLIYDAATTLAGRARAGRVLTEAHREHLYQRAAGRTKDGHLAVSRAATAASLVTGAGLIAGAAMGGWGGQAFGLAVGAGALATLALALERRAAANAG